MWNPQADIWQPGGVMYEEVQLWVKAGLISRPEPGMPVFLIQAEMWRAVRELFALNTYGQHYTKTRKTKK